MTMDGLPDRRGKTFAALVEGGPRRRPHPAPFRTP
jgi:hypothetical protein